MKKYGLIIIYSLLLWAYSVWSWLLVNPNLYFSTQENYVAIQNWLTTYFSMHRPQGALIYAVIIGLLFLVFVALAKKMTPAKTIGRWSVLFTILPAIIPLLFAYNALSSDVFNYLFNAKIVSVYHDNPHVKTALDYQADDWTRFMHNVHTPAPYGYGWTGVSLLPLALGMGKFSLSWWSFRLFNVVLLIAVAYCLIYGVRKIYPERDNDAWWLFCLSPLVLIEIIGNIHNDLWMMLPALWSVFLLYPRGHKKTLKTMVVSALCLIFSLSIKYATLALLPAWLYLILGSKIEELCSRLLKNSKVLIPKVRTLFLWVDKYFFDLCAVAMFLPLLTSRAQRFHPWYLSWALIFVPLARAKMSVMAFYILSLSAMLRYVPFLWIGEHTEQLHFTQQLITLAPVSIYLIISGLRLAYKHRRVLPKKGV